MIKNLLAAFIFLFIVNEVNSQNLRYMAYAFPADSISGFDEITAKHEALSRGFFGDEFKVFMYRSKRNFIVSKYGYGGGPSLTAKGGLTVLTAPCSNEDFESSASTTLTTAGASVGSLLMGWTVSQGQNTLSCGMGGCCPTVGSTNAWIRSTPYTAPAPLNTIPNSPLGGSKIIQLNDNITGTGEVARIEQTFPVTATNTFFQYAYMAALNCSGHACCDNPYITIQMFDCTNNPISCGTSSLVPPSSSCSSAALAGWTTNSSGVAYTTGWQVIGLDLSPYLGSCVTIRCTVGDCDGWAHEGWGFFDSKCGTVNMNVNSVPFAGTSYTSCSSVNLGAPLGFSNLWNGPAGSGITNNTTPSIVANTSGVYTLALSPLTGSCSAITQTININITGSPSTLTINSSNICAGASSNLNLLGTGITSYTWSTGANTSSILVTPSVTTTYSVSYTNTAGCVASSSGQVFVSAPASATIVPSSTFVCVGSSVTMSVSTAGATTYSWSNGANTSSIVVTPTTSVNYTVTGNSSSSGCGYFATQFINVSLCTGIIEQSMAATEILNVYPNPNDGTFYLQSKKDETVMIVNETGQLIRTISLNKQNKYKAEVSGLSDGIYFVTSEKVRYRIVVQK